MFEAFNAVSDWRYIVLFVFSSFCIKQLHGHTRFVRSFNVFRCCSFYFCCRAKPCHDISLNIIRCLLCLLPHHRVHKHFYFPFVLSHTRLVYLCYLIVQYHSRTVKLCKMISKVTLNKAFEETADDRFPSREIPRDMWTKAFL